MKRRLALSLLLSMPFVASAGELDRWFKDELHKNLPDHPLDPDTAAAGLRQALEHGTQHAVALLGRKNGYFGNPRVRIPLPENLARTEKLLRRVGEGQVADAFELSLNRAAEAAAPQAKAIFLNVIRNMSVKDAIRIVRGPDDAATRYFRAHSEAALRVKFRPIVAAATDRVGVTRRYKRLVQDAGPISMFVST